MISHNVKQVRITLAHENHRNEKLTWSGLFLHTPSKDELIAAMEAQILQVTEEHVAKHNGDTQADPGGLKIGVGQIECFKQVVAFWNGEYSQGRDGQTIWLNGYIDLAKIEIKDMIPLWMNATPAQPASQVDTQGERFHER